MELRQSILFSTGNYVTWTQHCTTTDIDNTLQSSQPISEELKSCIQEISTGHIISIKICDESESEIDKRVATLVGAVMLSLCPM